MVHEITATRNIPGPDPNLPGFIHDRMIYLRLHPTLSKLAEVSSIQVRTLQRNLNGERAIKLSTAKRLADSLDVSLDTLIQEVPSLISD